MKEKKEKKQNGYFRHMAEAIKWNSGNIKAHLWCILFCGFL